MASEHPTPSSEQLADMETFDALLWALSRPGLARALPGVSTTSALMTRLGRALLDLETSYCAKDAALDAAFQETGARRAPADKAEYLFLSQWDGNSLDMIAQAKTGDPLYPDRSATLFVPAAPTPGPLHQWSGPGVRDRVEVSLGAVPEGFWTLRNQKIQYPLGWDVVFVTPQGILGLPRTTIVHPLQD